MPLVVHRGAGAYICGEETALLDSLEGKRGNPRLKPPFPANQGLYQGPTLINNVETLCNVPHIIAQRRRLVPQFGTERSPGTKVVSVSGYVQRPGNYEVELGIPSRDIIYGLAGGPPDGRRVKAWFPGGSSAPVLTEEHLDLPYDFEHMAQAGSMLGSGAIIVVDDSVPIVSVALRLAEFYRHESCGKCVPCREGTNWTVKMLERIDRGEATPMDLDVMADVQEQHHRQLPVRAGRLDGDAGWQHDQPLQAGVRGAYRGGCQSAVGSRQSAGTGSPIVISGRGGLMSQGDWITFSIDGREVRAPEGEWLLDAAKRGDVEIPYFCYEKKLGAPVGACRMCMVEVEGMPKLQTSCSTPVKDGMVVYTQTDRVKNAQNAVVEFLLVNHPLDCPVCDKGGECPLQDIAFGWGPGRSRFVEDKRNFPKPIALSPLIAIDRERCILCYRCVRFSQEVAEDDQLMFLERGDHTFVGTFDGRPYQAPFSGQRDRPVPGRRAHQHLLPLPRAAVGHRGRRHRLHPLPEPVQRRADDPRRARRARAAARQRRRRRRLALRQGPLGLPVHRPDGRVLEPLVRDGGTCARRRWERALDAAAEGLRKRRLRGRGGRRRADHQRGGMAAAAHLPRGARLAATWTRARAARSTPRWPARLSHPDLAARSRTSTAPPPSWCWRRNPVDEAPIFDLRLRKAVRRYGTRLVVASSAPTALDGGATEVLRFAPGGAESLLRALQKALLETARRRRSEAGDGRAEAPRPAGTRAWPSCSPSTPLERLAETAEVDLTDLRDVAALLTQADNVVVIWGERLGWGERGAGALEALADLGLVLGLDARRGLGADRGPGRRQRRAACARSDAWPGSARAWPTRPAGLAAAQARDAALASARADGASICCTATRCASCPGSAAVGRGAAQGRASSSRTSSSSARRSIDHADVVFPAESYAEKEGTVTHPDGRLQRLRPAIGHPGEVRAGVAGAGRDRRRLGPRRPSAA